ncbi:uridine diphosphate-N-acetylglucosamine-binding protein YvcK [Corynebacterium accolens]|uniref:gluconeogenesis factor YvcK family protein n=1 Tax=Corynebacterium accolens TaxID=38284 RepID=UPI0025427977|nr:uridine diphosphate-N-acetylglucosamine-binding protein YvcK [Corynebacterium accolens]MDK4330548.1 uridine diphosphate-N-acetylglucosamine-binding protein YvcK [Corynebacterium accolens]
MEHPSHMVCLGGGHGLYQTLLSARRSNAADISAIVTVADDGGSSGRLRRELDIIPPGDLRMALAALADDNRIGELWGKTLQHRFGGNGAMAGHAVGNLMIAGLTGVLGDYQAALDAVAELTHSHGRVIPVVPHPLEIEADVSGLDDDPRVMRQVRGQVAVASTPGHVRRVRILPEAPQASPAALEAIRQADLITIGPGSWFSSVLPHTMVPEIVQAISESNALRVVMLNLSAEPGETQGFSAERHVHVLARHAPNLRIDRIVVDAAALPNESERVYVQRAAQALGARAVFADVSIQDDNGQRLMKHDPDKLSSVIVDLYNEYRRA